MKSWWHRLVRLVARSELERIKKDNNYQLEELRSKYEAEIEIWKSDNKNLLKKWRILQEETIPELRKEKAILAQLNVEARKELAQWLMASRVEPRGESNGILHKLEDKGSMQ